MRRKLSKSFNTSLLQLHAGLAIERLKPCPGPNTEPDPTVLLLFADNPQALDVTSTPNRLVYALLPSQAVFSRGTLEAGPGQQPATLQFRLDHRPSQVVHVRCTATCAGGVCLLVSCCCPPPALANAAHHRPTCSASTPLAGWANTPLATLRPRSFTISPDAWDQSQQLTLMPSIIANGDYHLTFIFT